MASLAGLLKESGFDVTGSDANIYPPMSTLLADLKIPVKPGFKRENITKDIDLVIVGNAISKTNEEAQAVLDLGIPYTSFPDALARFYLEGRKSLVVTGTHGKTTTTALLSWVLHACGKKPGFMVGGWLKNFDRNYRVPEGDYFVTEGDEYDTAFFDKGPKFLHYRPLAAILTGIEFDHADIYDDLDHFKSSFRKFVEIIDPQGFLLVRFADENVTDVLKNATCPVETYGLTEGADWLGADYCFEDGNGCFTLRHKGKDVGQIRLPMVGRHNVENTVAVSALAIKLGIPAEEVCRSFAGFKGIKRRQEVVGEKNGVVVIDDFAHHPTAIGLTIEGVQEAYPGARVWAVFEPRSATSRRNVFQETFPSSFAQADEVIIAQPYATEKIPPQERLDPKRLVDDIDRMGTKAHYIPEVADIVEFIAEKNRSQDVVLIMSSGGFSGIHQKLLDRL
ncbi:MAG: UDP-N-acetylmuramate:L-alanyl-gamma-D-glutamyl-me so-diaminopimelate ligase [Nitrospinaceae bacterium]|nr:MAG: UDP-N-acetylmuramate:L-alanyl-gamma-D-glutamyl-me so-diaminopimelate ligase [Nitrospinaceae bacterium]